MLEQVFYRKCNAPYDLQEEECEWLSPRFTSGVRISQWVKVDNYGTTSVCVCEYMNYNMAIPEYLKRKELILCKVHTRYESEEPLARNRGYMVLGSDTIVEGGVEFNRYQIIAEVNLI